MEIRQARPEDAREVSGVISELDTREYGYSDIGHVMDYIRRGRYYVLCENGAVVGAMALKPVEGSCQIYTIASRRKGGGRALVEYAIQKCRKEGVPKLWCWSMAHYKAKGFYGKLGFEEQYLLKKQWLGMDCFFFGKVID
ncbi:GNAT family N-acetyltransferase [Candidatus Micrarchaeota archaeon]|nr:GNAT family N-acetyltransferase [Candidatus Micrarchaeota archaeon]